MIAQDQGLQFVLVRLLCGRNQARITVTSGKHKQIDEVRSGGTFISQSDFRVHVGLGSASKADVSIRWPQGSEETFKDVAANQWIVVHEGKGIVERHSLNIPSFTSQKHAAEKGTRGSPP